MPFETNIAITLGFASITFAYIASTIDDKPSRILFYSLSTLLALVMVGSNYAVTEKLGDNTTAVTALVHTAFYPTLAITVLFIGYLWLSVMFEAFRPKSVFEKERDEENN